MAFDFEWARQGFGDLAGNAAHGLDILHVGQSNQKFVAALPADRVGVAQRGGETLGHLLEQQVAHRMPQGVVDLLEMVQIQVQQRQLALAALAPGLGKIETVTKQDPVGQAGERVVVREKLNARGVFLALGDVLGKRHHMRLVVQIDQLGRETHAALFAGSADPFGLEVERVSVVLQLCKPGGASLKVSPQAHFQRGPAHQFMRRPAKPGFVAVVDLDKQSIAHARNRRRERARTERHLETQFGLAQAGDVLHGAPQRDRLSRRITLHASAGKTHTEAAIGTAKTKLHFVSGILRKCLGNGVLHALAIFLLNHLQETLEGGDEVGRRKSETGKDLVAPTELIDGDVPLPVANARNAGRLVQPTARLFHVGDVVKQLELADAAVGVLQRNVKKIVRASVAGDPLPLHRTAREHLRVLAPGAG